MRIGISRVTRELGVKSHQLHKWEERGWLGTEPVLKDPDNNNQRVYSPEQIERIKFIHETIQEQRKKGVFRTDFKEMEEKLLDKFGGEVVTMEEKAIEVLPASAEAFQELLIRQAKELATLRDMVEELQNRELPASMDHTEDIQAIKKQTEGMATKEQVEELISQIREEKKTKLELEQELTLIKSKLDIAVEYIQKQEEVASAKEVEKKSIWKRLFG